MLLFLMMVYCFFIIKLITMRKDRRTILFITVIISCFLIGESVVARSKIRKSKETLKKYRERRNFTVTSEPSGNNEVVSDGPIYVIQEHDARRLHYDLRLEIGGVLKSWAVPKGPSLNPAVKRLAVETEDHPMSYADFEGVIPEGQYGAGPVMVWDIGTYENIKYDKAGKLVPMKTCYKEGRIEIALDGEKLHGDFALIRTQHSKDDKPFWLLIKMRDDYASAKKNPVTTETKSVLTGRTMKQIASFDRLPTSLKLPPSLKLWWTRLRTSRMSGKTKKKTEKKRK